MKLINFCIVYLAAQIGNKLEWVKSEIKLCILKLKEKKKQNFKR